MIATASTAGMMAGTRICDPFAVPADASPAVPSEGADASADAHLRRADAGAVAATGGVLRLQMRVVGLLLSLGATVLVARHLSEGDFGRLALVIALITVVSGISDLGLSGVGIREWVRRDPADRRELLADLIGLRLITMVIGTAIGLLVVAIAGYGSEVALGVAVAMVGVAFNAIQGALTIPLIADLRQGVVGALELLAVAVQAVLQALLALLGAGVVPLAAALIPAGLTALFAVVLVLKGQAPWPRFHVGPLLGLL
jgi:O-antigen/teichoic acid export membrane protein